MINKLNFEKGDELLPGKVVAVGRNYAAHISEMNSERTSEPVLFLKPSTALCDINQPLIIPSNYGSVHHEVELAICIGKKCSNISEDSAPEHIAGYGIALDLTLRDIQSQAKKGGLPWALAKGFNNSCPISTFYKRGLDEMQNAAISLHKNDIERQNSNTGHMIFPIATLIAYISAYFTLLPGDIVLTGTPAGVGPLENGDKLTVYIEHLETIKTSVISREKI